ncbi:MAG TPA: GNAT family N-acetyltransferase [Streptosporangiaceae bacterium]|nr:GNAT family N-acetyltransferase [Streptosporangiaceae bacterium]
MLEIQVLTPDDWPAWRELRLAALAEAPHQFGARLADWQGEGDQPARWRARLEIPGSLNLIALDDGVPAGMLSGVPGAEGVVELISMWVSPAARGKGAGRRLIAELIGWAAAAGAGELRLEVRPDNAPAIGLYERSGFARAGQADGVARNGTPDLVMTRPLTPQD